MDHTLIAGRGRERDDRLSRLGDGVLGHILSFLDAKEAARAATLSSRWRDVFAGVHTVSMKEPLGPIPDYDEDRHCRREPDPTLPFTAVVTAALFARHRRPAPAAASPPLRALRVAMESYGGLDAFQVDQWVTYAMKHAAPAPAPGLELDLRVCRVPLCYRPYSYPRAAAVSDEVVVPVYGDGGNPPVAPEEVDDDENAAASSTDSETAFARWGRPAAVYTVPRRLFSCSALRSLRLGSCRLSPPAVISLPSLEALHLTRVPDEQGHVQRLISACPRLADLTLEACATVTTLSLLDNCCLRRLVILCCHYLATVTVDGPELHSFEYRGVVPGSSLLTVRGHRGGGLPSKSITSCKIDVCAVCLDKEATSEEEVAALGSFLQPLASTTRRLHLRAARMGSCFVALPAFPALRHLQLNGRVPRDDPTALMATTCTFLRQAPELELLTLVFEPPRLKTSRDGGPNCYRRRKEGDLLDAHHLHYNQYDTVDYETAAIPACLESRVRRISLWHYQGCRAQRTMAKFLLRNARVLEELYCEFAQGPLWIQTELMREMEGWVVNDGASKEFH